MLGINPLRSVVPAVLLSSLMSHAGGWAVITVDTLPDYAVAGKPIELTYVIRQHGHTPLDDLRSTVQARSGRTTIDAAAVRAPKPGTYTTRLVLPAPGEWTITVRSGFGNSNLTLLPLTAVAEGSSLTRQLSDVERGERLFTSKGCITCHTQIQSGPSLDGKRFDVAYISRFLADPSIVPAKYNGTQMPNLALQQREIASLVTYLNSDRRVSAR